MAAILIVDSVPFRALALSQDLKAAGHAVSCESDCFQARERLSGPSFDLIIVDAENPDGGAGLLIAQARLAWTRTPVLAMVDRLRLACSKLAEMGLWVPDAVIESPCNIGAVTFAAHRLLRDFSQKARAMPEPANDRPGLPANLKSPPASG